MTILRLRKKKNPFVTIDKTPLLDTRLTWKARGLMAYLLTKPDNWTVNVRHLASQSDRDGRETVQTALRELESLNYVYRHRVRNEKGRFVGWETLVFETPDDFECWYQQTGFPSSGSPSDGKPVVGKPVDIVIKENSSEELEIKDLTNEGWEESLENSTTEDAGEQPVDLTTSTKPQEEAPPLANSISPEDPFSASAENLNGKAPWLTSAGTFRLEMVMGVVEAFAGLMQHSDGSPNTVKARAKLQNWVAANDVESLAETWARAEAKIKQRAENQLLMQRSLGEKVSTAAVQTPVHMPVAVSLPIEKPSIEVAAENTSVEKPAELGAQTVDEALKAELELKIQQFNALRGSFSADKVFAQYKDGVKR